MPIVPKVYLPVPEGIADASRQSAQSFEEEIAQTLSNDLN
jgi:hypothetical protein